MNPSISGFHKKPTGHRCLFALALLLDPIPAGLHAQSLASLTEQESLERTLQQPAVQDWIKGTLGQAQSDVIEQSQWKNPTFEYSLDAPSDRGQNATEQSYIISQPVDLSGRRGLRRAAAEHRLQAMEADTRAKLAQLAADMRHRFFAILYRQRRTEAHDRWTSELAEQESLIRKREAAGDVSGYDLRRLMRETASAEAQRQAEQAGLERSWEQLLSLWEAKAVPEVRNVSGILLPEPPRPLEELLQALPQNPELERLAREKSAAELKAHAAARWAFPEFDLGIGAKTFDSTDYSDTGLLLNFAVPIPLWNRNSAERMRYHAEAQMNEGQYRLAQQKTSGDIRALWKQVNGLVHAALTLEQRAKSVSEELVRIAATAYQGGEIGVIELLDAHRERLRYELEALDLAFQAREADIELDRLTAGIEL